MTSLPIHAATYEEYPALRRVIDHAFGEATDEEGAAQERELLEFDRTLAAIDGDDIVGSAAAYSLELTVPGGSVPAAGVTWVGVLPTHRRQGLLTSLMRRQLDDIHEAGHEPIAALWASEPAIYGRFGYGMAAPVVHLDIPRSADALRYVKHADEFRLRLVEPGASPPLVQSVYDHERGRRPGMFALTDKWQQARITVPSHLRGGRSPLRTLVVEDEEGVQAYARFLTKPEWSPSGPGGTITVREAYGNKPAAVAAVWAFLLDLDLSTHVEARMRAVDDPILGLLVDLRGSGAHLSDGLYVRIIDVAAALSARTFSSPVDVVVDLHDEFCPWNKGSWRISGDATGGSCERSREAPDLSIQVRDLGAAYLGGPTLSALSDAGMVVEHSPGAVRALSSALRHEPAPWCPIVF